MLYGMFEWFQVFIGFMEEYRLIWLNSSAWKLLDINEEVWMKKDEEKQRK